VLYAAKCYWPGVTEEEVASKLPSADGSRYVGAPLFPDEALVLCLFDAAAATAVSKTSRRAGLPCDRVMQALWISAAYDSRQTGRRV
jgi:hypothetical protein